MSILSLVVLATGVGIALFAAGMVVGSMVMQPKVTLHRTGPAPSAPPAGWDHHLRPSSRLSLNAPATLLVLTDQGLTPVTLALPAGTRSAVDLADQAAQAPTVIVVNKEIQS